MPTTKSIFASKTFWLSFLTTAAAIVSLLLQQEWAVDNETVTKVLMAVSGAIAIGLRWITTSPVTLTGEPQKFKRF
jgi:hypothetical protein